MKFLLIHLSILVLVYSSAKAESPTEPKCGPSEVFKSCGPPKQQTCETIMNDLFVNLNMCLSGCFCEDGYARNATGNCIPISSCPKVKCDDSNAQYSECKDKCPVTCQNRNNPNVCTEVCEKPGGCRCKPGYVRDTYNRCIKPTSCPSRSGKICPTDPNAIVTPCGDACPINCENKDYTGPRACPRICLQDGCRCKEGFVMGPNGLCILPSSCPIKEKAVPY